MMLSAILLENIFEGEKIVNEIISDDGIGQPRWKGVTGSCSNIILHGHALTAFAEDPLAADLWNALYAFLNGE